MPNLLEKARIMQFKHLFPTILIILDICAAGAYGISRDGIRVLYWLGAALLTFCSIFMK